MYRRIRQSVVAFAMAATAVTVISSIAHAQRSEDSKDRLKGLMFGAHSVAAQGVAITNPDIGMNLTTEFGTGAGVMIGYGFNRFLTGYAALDVAKQESAAPEFEGTFGLVHGEVGVRANLAMGNSATVPYVSAGVGGRALGARIRDVTVDEPYSLTISGGLFAVGGGIQHFFSRTMALDAGVTVGTGEFDKFQADGEQVPLPTRTTRSIRVRAGFNWRP